MDYDRKPPRQEATPQLAAGIASNTPAGASLDPVERLMGRLKHLVAMTDAGYAAGGIVERDGVRWRVLRVTFCTSPHPEDGIMSVSAPPMYLIDLELASS